MAVQELEMQQEIIKMLKTVYDPEIPVDIYELGLIYNIEVSEQGEANIEMTLTSPSCPASDFILE
ncbi:MAG: iron-sulfur cluster assembly protein, partial [Bacteroides sp.]|nr:iron-sulfur cluster assembly protein [Bacteroides sp.]